jgi:phosphoribosylamine--glycine ligase
VATNVPLGVDDFQGLADFCADNRIDLMVVGPEVPLVKGIRDFFEKDDRLKSVGIVGPGKSGARLEGSKDFSKQFMIRHAIPTAKAKTFGGGQLQEALKYLQNCQPPIVLKADGLAAGKGVIITSSKEEAAEALRDMLEKKKFGEAGDQVLLEEYLDGIELSVFVLTDGKSYVLLPEAKDYKRIGDGDKGPNTGGMGSVSPVAFANQDFISKVESRIVKPTIDGLHKEGIPYTGFIFIGLMNVKGDPYVIEYNARMGDPETQSVVSRIQSDLAALLMAAAKGQLDRQSLQIDPDYTLTVVMASGGYPDHYAKGKPIAGLENNGKATVFHAGTSRKDHQIVTDGGRVLGICGKGKTLQEATQQAYDTISRISWEGVYFRKDIGADLAALSSTQH